MNLVMKRQRLEGGITWNTFKINARMTIDEDESSLIRKYSLRNVVLTPGNTPRDLRKAAWISGIISLLLYFILLHNIGVTLLVFLVAGFLVYAQIREEVRVEDLLTGRDFGARSLVQLLVKENRIRKMSGVFAIVIEQARTWHEPEVIPIEPQPLGLVLEARYEDT
jgi:hypothetical protein